MLGTNLTPTNMTEMSELEITGLLASRNLSVGTWTNTKGEKHISLTRMGRYNKNIAIPLELVPAVVDALISKALESE